MANMPKTTPKRPRDLNQWAKRMVDLATEDDPKAKGPAAKYPRGPEADVVKRRLKKEHPE
jgi:hypothetical protein